MKRTAFKFSEHDYFLIALLSWIGLLKKVYMIALILFYYIFIMFEYSIGYSLIYLKSSMTSNLVVLIWVITWDDKGYSPGSLYTIIFVPFGRICEEFVFLPSWHLTYSLHIASWNDELFVANSWGAFSILFYFNFY